LYPSAFDEISSGVILIGVAIFFGSGAGNPLIQRFIVRRLESMGENEIPVFDERTMETNVSGVYIAGTATGGTQARYRIFLENCHIHIDRILASIIGAPSPPTPQPLAQPES